MPSNRQTDGVTKGPLIKRMFPGGSRGRRPSPTDLLVWGAAVHMAVDWLTQNEWIAENKHRVGHPSGYLHATSHAAGQALVFPPPYAAALGVLHMIVDTREPMKLWGKIVSQPDDGATAVSVQIWRDQVAHVGFIAFAAMIADARKDC
jgi:hypothetical protein